MHHFCIIPDGIVMLLDHRSLGSPVVETARHVAWTRCWSRGGVDGEAQAAASSNLPSNLSPHTICASSSSSSSPSSAAMAESALSGGENIATVDPAREEEELSASLAASEVQMRANAEALWKRSIARTALGNQSGAREDAERAAALCPDQAKVSEGAHSDRSAVVR